MTTANKVTICRILLIPFFVISVLYYVKSGLEFYRWLALACFASASLSDALDGFLARHFNQRSELGAVLDPLADKLLLLTGIILLSLRHEPHLPPIPMWLTVTVLSRDALIIIGIVIIYFFVGRVEGKPSFIGKSATVLQMVAVLWVLFKWNTEALFWICVSAALFTGISGLLYVFDGMRLLSVHPSSGAGKRDSD
jgi:cardiolipin synthase (CMP-forming)